MGLLRLGSVRARMASVGVLALWGASVGAGCGSEASPLRERETRELVVDCAGTLLECGEHVAKTCTGWAGELGLQGSDQVLSADLPRVSNCARLAVDEACWAIGYELELGPPSSGRCTAEFRPEADSGALVLGRRLVGAVTADPSFVPEVGLLVVLLLAAVGARRP